MSWRRWQVSAREWLPWHANWSRTYYGQLPYNKVEIRLMPKWLRAKITFPATATKRGKRRATCWVLTLQNLSDIFNSLAALSSPGGVVNVRLKVGSSIRFPTKMWKKTRLTKCEKTRFTSKTSDKSRLKVRGVAHTSRGAQDRHSSGHARHSRRWLLVLLLHYILFMSQVTYQLENFVFLIANVCTRRKTACEQGLRLHRSASLVCRESW